MKTTTSSHHDIQTLIVGTIALWLTLMILAAMFAPVAA